MQLECDGVKVIHAAHLFSLMHQCSPNYEQLRFDDWWFAVGSSIILCKRDYHSLILYKVGTGALRHLKPGNDWSKRPSGEWIRSAKLIMSHTLVGSSMKELTNVVTRKFLDHWNVRKQVDLTKPEMWRSPPIYPGDEVTELDHPTAAVFNAQTFDATA